MSSAGTGSTLPDSELAQAAKVEYAQRITEAKSEWQINLEQLSCV
jgi:hypothetical protein